MIRVIGWHHVHRAISSNEDGAGKGQEDWGREFHFRRCGAEDVGEEEEVDV